jgi:hypothetical protein
VKIILIWESMSIIVDGGSQLLSRVARLVGQLRAGTARFISIVLPVKP